MYLISYSFFMYLENEEQERMSRIKNESECLIIVYKEKETIINNKKI